MNLNIHSIDHPLIFERNSNRRVSRTFSLTSSTSTSSSTHSQLQLQKFSFNYKITPCLSETLSTDADHIPSNMKKSPHYVKSMVRVNHLVDLLDQVKLNSTSSSLSGNYCFSGSNGDYNDNLYLNFKKNQSLEFFVLNYEKEISRILSLVLQLDKFLSSKYDKIFGELKKLNFFNFKKQNNFEREKGVDTDKFEFKYYNTGENYSIGSVYKIRKFFEFYLKHIDSFMKRKENKKTFTDYLKDSKFGNNIDFLSHWDKKILDHTNSSFFYMEINHNCGKDPATKMCDDDYKSLNLMDCFDEYYFQVENEISCLFSNLFEDSKKVVSMLFNLVELDKEIYFYSAFIIESFKSLKSILMNFNNLISKSTHFDEEFYINLNNKKKFLNDLFKVSFVQIFDIRTNLIENLYISFNSVYPNIEDFQCAICIDVFYRPVILSDCNHKFCYSCLKKCQSHNLARSYQYSGTSNSLTSKCPLCRTPFVLKTSKDAQIYPQESNRNLLGTNCSVNNLNVKNPKVLPDRKLDQECKKLFPREYSTKKKENFFYEFKIFNKKILSRLKSGLSYTGSGRRANIFT